MSDARAAAGDRARASLLVRVPPAQAFRIFTEDIDLWWRRGLRYRIAGAGRGIISMEPRVGGRLFESFDDAAGAHIHETGRIIEWLPPDRKLQIAPPDVSMRGKASLQRRNPPCP